MASLYDRFKHSEDALFTAADKDVVEYKRKNPLYRLARVKGTVFGIMCLGAGLMFASLMSADNKTVSRIEGYLGGAVFVSGCVYGIGVRKGLRIGMDIAEDSELVKKINDKTPMTLRDIA